MHCSRLVGLLFTVSVMRGDDDVWKGLQLKWTYCIHNTHYVASRTKGDASEVQYIQTADSFSRATAWLSSSSSSSLFLIYRSITRWAEHLILFALCFFAFAFQRSIMLLLCKAMLKEGRCWDALLRLYALFFPFFLLSSLSLSLLFSCFVFSSFARRTEMTPNLLAVLIWGWRLLLSLLSSFFL